MVDLDEYMLAKLAREMVMNIRNYKAVFDDYGISEEDYYEIEKNEFYKKVKEQYAIEWNSTTSTKDRLKIGSLAYLEQLYPVMTRRAMAETTPLAASAEVGKLLQKSAGIGEDRNDKSTAERFVITINLGGEETTYDKAIDVTPHDIPASTLVSAVKSVVKPPAKRKSRYKQVEAAKHGQADDKGEESDPVQRVRPAGQRQRGGW